jgi:hypothetical protein
LNTLEELRNGQLAGSSRLTLSCGLTEFPREIFQLADTLEILDLSGNALSSLPEDLPRLSKLRILFCSNNRFTRLPEVLGRCRNLSMVGFKANQISEVPPASLSPALRWLILTDNQITEIPPEIGNCTRLQKLMLAGNRLRSLPREMAACTNLELLRISANQLTALPDWLLSLPRLAWIAYAGNPFCAPAEQGALERSSIPNIEWKRLDLRQKLGEGASGVIHRAGWQGDEGTREVAVKLFKGDVTSDGLPHSEMAACLAAGSHANLIGMHGKVVDHPEGVQGLVMSLVAHHYRNLAGPPSLDSCTRDVYAQGVAFTPAEGTSIALGIASAAAHLHARGILHGDLYAHNILYGEQAEALLGDFGAASFLGSEQGATALQRIEVRAFACLLEEMLQRCADAAGDQSTLGSLRTLQARCAQEAVAERPLFFDIVAALREIRH